MKYLSLFSGIEAATVAWHPLGWHPIAFSEIEPFPCAVLAHHYPAVPNLGDVTKFHDWPELEPDVLVGGSPCQSFSVAGLRKGLDDPRGNLTLTYLAIVERYRPRRVVWENVPGVLSDGTGAFGAFLGGLAKLGYGFAYRVLDAQFFGVPQRRRRVFVVGYLGDWRAAAAVLFECASLRGDPAPRREARQDLAPTISARTKGGGGLGTDAELDGGLIPDVAWCLQERDAKGADSDTKPGHLIPVVSDPISANEQRTFTHEGKNFRLRNAIAFSCKDSGHDAGEVAPTLRGMNDEGGNANAGGQIAVAFKPSHYTRGKDGAPSEIAPPLSADADKGDQDPLVFESRYARNGRGAPSDLAPPLKAQSGQTGKGDAAPLLMDGIRVRRLTPRECERLQGFPDDYTLIPYRSKLAADGPRYKALGNSMAVPVMRWIGERIQLLETINAYQEGVA